MWYLPWKYGVFRGKRSVTFHYTNPIVPSDQAQIRIPRSERLPQIKHALVFRQTLIYPSTLPHGRFFNNGLMLFSLGDTLPGRTLGFEPIFSYGSFKRTFKEFIRINRHLHATGESLMASSFSFWPVQIHLQLPEESPHWQTRSSLEIRINWILKFSIPEILWKRHRHLQNIKISSDKSLCFFHLLLHFWACLSNLPTYHASHNEMSYGK